MAYKRKLSVKDRLSYFYRDIKKINEVIINLAPWALLIYMLAK